MRIRVRKASDFPAIRALAGRVYPQDIHPPEAVWTDELLGSHLRAFEAGQLVAEGPQGLVGDSTSLRVDLARALAPHTWDELTGAGTLSTHDPTGDTLYGVDIMVDPDHRGTGVGAALYQARFELAHSLGCTGFAAGARIPGYREAAPTLSLERYVEEVATGRRFDPTLSRQLAQGFQVRGLLSGYFPDPESLDFAVLIYRPIP